MKFVREGFEIRLIGAIIITLFGGIYVFKPNYWLLLGVLFGAGVMFFGGSKRVLRKLK